MAMAAAGIGQVVSGVFKKNKAASIAASNIRPEYKVNQNTQDNVDIAESMAGAGLSDNAKQAFTTNADRGLTSTIDAILKSGTGGNQIGNLNENYLSSLSNMSMAEDEARFRNINVYMRTKDALKDEQDKAWQINQYAPWADRAQLASNLSSQGTQEIWGGINTGISAFASMKQGNTNPNAGAPGSGMQTGGSPSTAQPLTMSGYNNFRNTEKAWGASTMFSGAAPAINYTPKSVSTLAGLGIKPVSFGPAMPDGWQTGGRTASNPYMWAGLGAN